MADRWSLRLPAAGIVVARARTAWSPGLVIRRLPGWADSASDTIVTVRRRAWGQIGRFRRRVPLLHPAPERFDHGGQQEGGGVGHRFQGEGGGQLVGPFAAQQVAQRAADRAPSWGTTAPHRSRR